MKTLALALNSFRDAIRQKILLLFIVIAFGLVFLSRFILGLNMSTGQMGFVADFGFGALSFFGVIIAIVSTCQLMHSEYDNKSIYLILSKSVSSLEYVLGKFLGISLLLFIYSFCIAILTMGLLIYTQSTLVDVPEMFLKGGRQELNIIGFLSYAFLQFLKLCLVSLFTLLVCCVSRGILFSIVISFCIYMISLLASSALFAESSSQLYAFMASIFPKLALFDSARAFMFGQVDVALFFYVLGYAFVYIVVLLLFSAFIFSRREY